MKFSVSMSVYNGDNYEYFDLALESVCEQTLRPDEVVLVVDGYVNDDINRVIKKYQEKYQNFKVIQLEKNMGLGIARKVGIDATQNSIVTFMDSDDISVPERFEKQIKIFEENSDVGIVGGQITEFIGDISNVVGKREVPYTDEDIKEYMKKRCPMNHVTVMMKKESLNMAGGYIDWFCNEDYYLWIRMAQKGIVFMNVEETLVNVRVGNEMYQRRGGIKYFKSEAKLQKYMYDNKMIGFGRYFINVLERLILQVLMPNKLRGWVFRNFARKK